MKFNLIGALLLACTATTAWSTEYNYRDLMGNTLPSARCETEAKAKDTAAKTYNVDRYSRKFCQTQGYGWHVEAVKSTGNVACNSCGNSNELQKCHLEDMVVTCKRIKPGSVGMLPGKG